MPLHLVFVYMLEVGSDACLCKVLGDNKLSALLALAVTWPQGLNPDYLENQMMSRLDLGTGT